MKMKKMQKNIIERLFSLILSTGIFIALFTGNAAAQGLIKVTGTVMSAADKVPLPGVSIVVKGTSTGTVASTDGKYSIEVTGNATLVFSFIGFKNQEVNVQGKNTIDIVMEESIESIDEVVVTALGIKREEKSLGFSVGKVGGEELTRVAQENVLNSMAGKVSGVTISSTGGTGSSVNMVIRGASSLTSDNQPLFVIDGVPMESTDNNVGGFGKGNRVDYGNAIANIDPESIESITILKGANAAALYGSRAGDGVVMITTKKAKDKQAMKVTITSNTVFDIPSRFLNTNYTFANGTFSYQPQYTGGIIPAIDPTAYYLFGPEMNKGYWAVQWNAPLDANGVPIPTELRSYPDNVKNFLNGYAFTTSNSASVSSGGELVNYRIGVTNMTHSGLIPNSDLNKNTVTLSASSKVNSKLTISTDINFSNSWAKNRPSSNVSDSNGTNPLQYAYFTPPNIDIRTLRQYKTPTGILRVSTQDQHNNPWFMAYEVNNSFNNYLLFGNLAATWEVAPKLSITARYSLNKSDGTNESKIAPGYTKEPNNGAYGISNSDGFERNTDILATWKNDWENFSLSLSGGGNVLYSKSSYVSNSSKDGAGLNVPNVYTIQNISSGGLNYSNGRYEREINSLYAMANLAWKEIAYVDLTARNDWSSTLPKANRSYFYPSASLSLILDKILHMGRDVNMFKLRGGIAQIGNDTSPYNLKATYDNAGQWGDAVRLSKSGTQKLATLKPELITSYEYGVDVRMFSNRLRFEGTLYQNDNKNQIFSVPLPGSTEFSSTLINAGLIKSTGVELLIGFTPVKTIEWQWDVNVNFTTNKTRVLELAEKVPFIQAWDAAGVRSMIYAKDTKNGFDGKVGDLYSRKIKRVTDKDSKYYGYPLLRDPAEVIWEYEDEYSKIGNYNPDFIMGMQTSLTYKNFTLSATFDWRSGGQYVSQTSRYLMSDGLNKIYMDDAVNAGELAGAPSDALRDWVIANGDKLLFSDRPVPVGGMTPERGGFLDPWAPATVYDAGFVPGVLGEHDANGKFILTSENLGNEGTYFLPMGYCVPWDIGTANMFDADYIKLREISLGYSLPNRISQQVGLQDVNFSVYSRNIVLWTKDSRLGVDPERAFQASGSGFLQGIERYNVDPWVVPIGFKLSFSF